MEEYLHKLLNAATTGKLIELFTAGLLASMGGAAQTLYTHVREDKPLNFWLFIINLFLAFFVGQVVGSFVPTDFIYRDGVLLVAGFTTYPILGVIQDQAGEYVKKILNRFLGPIDNE